MAILTREERAWAQKLEKLLLNPPSDRIGMFTIGDPCISLYDLTLHKQIWDEADREGVDFVTVANDMDAMFDYDIRSKTNIEGVAG